MDRGNDEIDQDEKKALEFNESDPKFRVFICKFRIVPVFVAISVARLVLLISALFFTVAQLISYSTTTISSTQDGQLRSSNYTSIDDAPRESPPTNRSSPSSWTSSILYFESSWWLELAYFRLAITFVTILGIVAGLYGVWRQRERFVLATVCTDIVLIVFLVGYMTMLVWHSIKYEDYFVFCIGGLTVLCLLLINVLSLHSSRATYKYVRSIRAFVRAARTRWPDSYDEAVRIVRQRATSERQNGGASSSSSCRPIVFVVDRLARRYEEARELSRIASYELSRIVRNRPKMRLHDIEEVAEIEDEEEEGTN